MPVTSISFFLSFRHIVTIPLSHSLLFFGFHLLSVGWLLTVYFNALLAISQSFVCICLMPVNCLSLVCLFNHFNIHTCHTSPNTVKIFSVSLCFSTFTNILLSPVSFLLVYIFLFFSYPSVTYDPVSKFFTSVIFLISPISFFSLSFSNSLCYISIW